MKLLPYQLKILLVAYYFRITIYFNFLIFLYVLLASGLTVFLLNRNKDIGIFLDKAYVLTTMK